MCKTHFWKEHLCTLQVSLCALVSRLVCVHARAQLRGNIAHVHYSSVQCNHNYILTYLHCTRTLFFSITYIRCTYIRDAQPAARECCDPAPEGVISGPLSRLKIT